MFEDPAPRQPREGRPQSVQLALRVAMLGGLAVVLFAVLFFRLWVLQVLSAERYQTAAAASQARTVRVQAPRGRILDVNGNVLVGNRPGDAITFDLASDEHVAEACAQQPPKQAPPPPAPTKAQLRKLLKGLKGKKRARRRAQILAASEPKPVPKVWRGCARENATLVTLAERSGTPIAAFEDRIHEALTRAPFEPVTLIEDAERPLIFYIKENGMRFPGVRIAKRTLRDYPAYDASLKVGYAAQIFGTIGEVTKADIDDTETYPGAKPGDVVGHSGIERSYDRWLRGRDGTLNVTVDAQGNPQGRATLSPAPVPGRDVRLTLDINLQHAAENALRKGISVARQSGGPDGKPMPKAARGALLVMDVKTGAIRAVASWPSFNPRQTVGKGADAYYAKLFSKKNTGTPLLDRAINGIYPPGSTFKPVTAIASIESGLSTVSDEILCGKDLVVDGQKYRNFETDTNSYISLRTALAQSCDTYFYALGARLYDHTSKNGDFQPQPQWMRKLGFGSPTGLDIPDSAGVAPDAAYKKKLFGKDAINNRWTSGDAVNASIGQGFVQVTPLQMATLYALIANGGTLVTPHLAQAVEDPGGDIVKQLRFKARRKVDIDPFVLETIRSGLRGVTHDVSGTAAKAFAGFPVGVAGKTGTAQKPPLDDFAWFVGYAPIEDPQLVTVAVIEQGGFGGVGAARAVRDTFAAAFNARPGKLPTRYRTKTAVIKDASQIINGTQLGDPEAPPPTTTDTSPTTSTAAAAG
jgi:penicillin-binding protein 2